MTPARPDTAAGAGPLAHFQDAFARALLDPAAEARPEVRELCAQPAFAVYRNTVMKGCVDALQANFPAVARLVGEEWFRAAAAAYVRGSPPRDPSLLRYGGSFPAFLADFEPAAALPYLPAVARLDFLWTESHAAATRAALNPRAVAGLAPAELAATALTPHPAARWAWSADAPAFTIWSRNRDDRDHDAPLEWRPEGALLTRPGSAVEWRQIGAGGCAFLDACAATLPLRSAARAALATEPAVDLAGLMSTLLAAGAFCSMRLGAGNHASGEE